MLHACTGTWRTQAASTTASNNLPHAMHSPPPPRNALPLHNARPQVAIVCCMDSRLVITKMLGLDIGDVEMLRNAGGLQLSWLSLMLGLDIGDVEMIRNAGGL